MADWDLKDLMLRLLTRQQEYVREDLEKYACAMVAVFTADGQSYLCFPNFEGEATKVEAYTGIVQEAKKRKAVIIITVNDAFTRSGYVPDDYQWGDLNEGNAVRCIMLTASGPGIKNTLLECRYTTVASQVEFEAPDFDTENVDLGLLPDWPDSTTSMLN